MTKQASGTFEVDLNPQPFWDEATSPPLSRLSLDKQFSGDLQGSSKGEMLSTQSENSAGYVALENVTGELSGRKGSFVLQHSGTMTRGEGTLSVTVVPGSGTGELVGLEGKMSIEGSGGEHRYMLEYSFAEKNEATR